MDYLPLKVILPPATTWMNPADVMPGETSHHKRTGTARSLSHKELISSYEVFEVVKIIKVVLEDGGRERGS